MNRSIVDSRAQGEKRFEPRSGPVPYLVVGLGWFLFLMFAFRVKTIEPIFLWVLTQGLIIEQALKSHGGWWTSRGLLFAGYMAAALVAWMLVEKPRSNPSHRWRRAALSWVGIQALYCLIATALVQFGILYE